MTAGKCIKRERGCVVSVKGVTYNIQKPWMSQWITCMSKHDKTPCLCVSFTRWKQEKEKKSSHNPLAWSYYVKCIKWPGEARVRWHIFVLTVFAIVLILSSVVFHHYVWSACMCLLHEAEEMYTVKLSKEQTSSWHAQTKWNKCIYQISWTT